MEFKAEMQTKESYPLGFIISQSTLLDTAGIWRWTGHALINSFIGVFIDSSLNLNKKYILQLTG